MKKKAGGKKKQIPLTPLDKEAIFALSSNFITTHVAPWKDALNGTLSITADKEINSIALFNKVEYHSYVFHRGKPRWNSQRDGQHLFINKTPLPSWDNGTGHGQDEPTYEEPKYFEIYGMPFRSAKGERLMIPMHLVRALPTNNLLFKNGLSPEGREYKLSNIPYTIANYNQIKQYFAQGGQINKDLIDPHFFARDLQPQETADSSRRTPRAAGLSGPTRSLHNNHGNLQALDRIRSSQPSTPYWQSPKNTPSTTPWDSHRSSSSYPPPSYYSSRRSSFHHSPRSTDPKGSSSRVLVGCLCLFAAIVVFFLGVVFTWMTWDSSSEKKWLYILYLIVFMVGFIPLAFVPRFLCHQPYYRATHSEC